MPKLGESVTEGTIGKWLKKPGDTVNKYDLLVEVQTDKVNTEIPSPVSGTLREVKVEEGQTVPIGTLLAIFDTAEAETAAASPAAAAPRASQAQPSAPPPNHAPGPAPRRRTAEQRRRDRRRRRRLRPPPQGRHRPAGASLRHRIRIGVRSAALGRQRADANDLSDVSATPAVSKIGVRERGRHLADRGNRPRRAACREGRRGLHRAASDRAAGPPAGSTAAAGRTAAAAAVGGTAGRCRTRDPGAAASAGATRCAVAQPRGRQLVPLRRCAARSPTTWSRPGAHRTRTR